MFEKFIEIRKDKNLRCGEDKSFVLLDIYEETFKRLINPIYIIILSCEFFDNFKSKINFYKIILRVYYL